MWYSVRSISKPKNLQNAFELSQISGNAIYGGGSYLVAEKNENIHTLIDINHLIGNNIQCSYEKVSIDAGVSLQQFIDEVTTINSNCRLLSGVRYATPSKNIRNQRCFGGELGQNRPNSDILVFLHAINAELTVVTKNESKVKINDWDGIGIIKNVTYYPKKIDSVEIVRHAPIPSASSIVCVVCTKENDALRVSIGGRCKIIQTFTIPAQDFNDDKIEQIASNSIKFFETDHMGSLEFKKLLIATLIKRAGDNL